MTAASEPQTVTITIDALELGWLAHALQIAAVVTANNSQTYLTASRILRQLGHHVPHGGDPEPTPRGRTPR